MTPSLATVFAATLLAAALAFSCAPVYGDNTTSCTLFRSDTTNSLALPSAAVDTAVLSLASWSLSSVGSRGSSLFLHLTLLLSPAVTASESAKSRFCAHLAKPLKGQCTQVSVHCSLDDQGDQLGTAHTPFARTTDGELEIFHLCTPRNAVHTHVVRTSFRWASGLHTLAERRRSVIGSVPGIVGKGAALLTTWLMGGTSALLVSLSASEPFVAELQQDASEGLLALHPAFSLEMADILDTPQRLSGCWDPLSRVGAIIVEDVSNNTGLTVFTLPSTEFLEPLPLLVASQAAPRPTDTRRCVRRVDNFLLQRCWVSHRTEETARPKSSDPTAVVVVEARDYPECHTSEQEALVYFQTIASFSRRWQWSVSPLYERSNRGSTTDGVPTSITQSKGPLCTAGESPLSNIVMCSGRCAELVREWWTTPGRVGAWCCRTTGYTLTELVYRTFLCVLTVAVASLLLRAFHF